MYTLLDAVNSETLIGSKNASNKEECRREVTSKDEG